VTMTESEVVRYERSGPVATVTLAADHSRNALSLEVMLGLSAALHRAVEEDQRAVVLASSGHVFCSGGDLAAVSAAFDGAEEKAGPAIEAMVDQLHRIIRDLRGLPIPTVAALNGPAVGAGMALALAADVRVASRSATFVTGYIAVNASPDGGASYHLARALGGPMALSSLLLNRRFGATELAALGLVDEVVDDDALPAALACAGHLAGVSRRAMSAMRSLVYGASCRSLEEQLDAEREQFLRIAQTPEFRSGVSRLKRA
jgi:2-(1,2-epoxy-1,2-dihydrophenyl)acetyl-CoA isomerase